MTMKFDELLAIRIRGYPVHVTLAAAQELAIGVIDLLGESQPCGMEHAEPAVYSDGRPGVCFGEDCLSAAEARAFAATILRAADTAEDTAKEHVKK